MANFCVFLNPVDKWQNGKGFLYLFGFTQVFFNGIAMEGTISKFCYTHLRGKDLIGRCLCNMPIHPASLMKILNPRICIENKAFHNSLVF